MKMDRRDFLKLFGLAGAAVAVGALPVGDDPVEIKEGQVLARGELPQGTGQDMGWAVIHDPFPLRFKINGDRLVQVPYFEAGEDGKYRRGAEYAVAPFQLDWHFSKDIYEVRIDRRAV